MDRETWRATVHGVAKSQIQLSNKHTHIFSTADCSTVGRVKWFFLHVPCTSLNESDFIKYKSVKKRHSKTQCC